MTIDSIVVEVGVKSDLGIAEAVEQISLESPLGFFGAQTTQFLAHLFDSFHFFIEVEHKALRRRCERLVRTKILAKFIQPDENYGI
jgi:hypothetical protein